MFWIKGTCSREKTGSPRRLVSDIGVYKILKLLHGQSEVKADGHCLQTVQVSVFSWHKNRNFLG
jgi:hypothetical protein